MKTTYLVRVFTLLFFVMTTSTNAQSTVPEINFKALQTTTEIQLALQLNIQTYSEIYKAYVEYESRLASLESIPGNPGYVAELKKIFQILLQKRIKLILNDQTLFDKYLTVTNQMDLSDIVIPPNTLPEVTLVGNTNQGPPTSAPTVTLYQN